MILAAEIDWMAWLDRAGYPITTVIVLLVIARSIWTWFRPHLDKLIEAQVKKHESEEEAIVKLTEKTIEIQQANSVILNEIKNGLPSACRWKP